MTPGLSGGLSAPILSPAFKPVDADPIVERIDKTTTRIFDAFNARDQAAYLAAYAELPIILPEGSGLLMGLADVDQMYLQSPARLVYEPMRATDRSLYQMGDIIVETQLLAFNFRLYPEAPMLSDYRQAITIWQAEPDGDLKVKLLAWNKLDKPAALERQTAPAAWAFAGDAGSFTTSGDFSAVLEAEERFHQAFKDERMEVAAEYYADGAVLNAPRALPLHGRERILGHLLGLSPDQLATKVERQVAHIEGNANLVLVINLFRWEFQPNGAEFPVSVAGKGVHLWERDADGSWRILFDLPNANQPTS